jgi:hypothetical protein
MCLDIFFIKQFPFIIFLTNLLMEANLQIASKTFVLNLGS